MSVVPLVGVVVSVFFVPVSVFMSVSVLLLPVLSVEREGEG